MMDTCFGTVIFDGILMKVKPILIVRRMSMEPVLATLWPSAPPRFPPQQRLLHRPDNCHIKDQMMS